MLIHLLELFEHNQGGLGLHELSRQLDLSPGAVQGMLELLVRRGRLTQLGPDGGCCTDCTARGECNLLVWNRVRYVVTRPNRKSA